MNPVTRSVSTRQSEVWQTNTGVIDTGDGVILIDPGVLAAELDALVADIDGRQVVAGFATHYHWDHILWTAELGEAPRFASTETCELAGSRRAHIERTLDGFEAHVAETYGLGPQWDRSLLYGLTPMEVGPGMIAGVRCELVDVSGHCDGQVALVLPEHDVAFVADTLSDIEVPSLAEGEGQRERYLATLERLQGVIERVSWVVPGHGSVADRAEAQRRLELDRRYLEHLGVAVDAAPAGQTDEELAASILGEIGETRAGDGLSAGMHLDNVRILRGRR
jgi:glyoxylase-like metal-dependent hydrolase (beta-lactamase superfamily II)